MFFPSQISITAIPQAKWNTQYIQPELLCRMYNNSCISANYQVPSDAIQLIAFSRRTQDKVVATVLMIKDNVHFLIMPNSFDLSVVA